MLKKECELDNKNHTTPARERENQEKKKKMIMTQKVGIVSVQSIPKRHAMDPNLFPTFPGSILHCQDGLVKICSRRVDIPALRVRLWLHNQPETAKGQALILIKRTSFSFETVLKNTGPGSFEKFVTMARRLDPGCLRTRKCLPPNLAS